MEQTEIFWPVIVLAALTFGVAVRLGALRFSAQRKGDVQGPYYATFQEGREPEHIAQNTRNLVNLFEFPILFYLICILSFVTGTVDQIQLNLAWAYVGGRMLHSAIHLSYNNVLHRFLVFIVVLSILMAMWIRFALAL